MFAGSELTCDFFAVRITAVQERCYCTKPSNTAQRTYLHQFLQLRDICGYGEHSATRCTPIMTMHRLRTVPPRRDESSSSAPERAWSPRRMLLAIRFALAILVWAAPSPTTGTLFLLFSLGCAMAKELPASARRLRRPPRRRESVPPIPTAAVDAYFTVTERGAPCFAGG